MLPLGHKADFTRWLNTTRSRLIAGLFVVCVGFFVVLAIFPLATEPTHRRAGQIAQPLEVHALTVDRGDRTVFIGAHNGLFRLGRGATKPQRVNDDTQDTTGLAGVGPGRLLASGHGERNGRSGLLGLIRSADGGKSWNPVSLTRAADFHVLRARGRNVVGYDVARRRVMLSRDGGRTWRARRFVGPLSDLVISPTGPRDLLATTQAQLVRSRDGGRSWRALSEAPGLLAWPRTDRLFLLATDGGLWLSTDGGRRWRLRGKVGGRPRAFVVLPRRMYAALADGTLKVSSTGGVSWRALTRPDD